MGGKVGSILILPLLWIIGSILASAWFRRSSGKAIVPHVPNDAVFYEDWTSGRSLRNSFTRVGGARNCLLVYVAAGHLNVVPRFPFTLMFLPELYGLDLRVPLTSIASAEPVKGWMGRAVRVSFQSGGPAPIELKLRDEEGFINQLGDRVLSGGARSIKALQKSRPGYKLTAFRLFMAVWGLGGLTAAFVGLPDDFRFRRDGVETTGVFDGHSGDAGDRNDMGVLSYSVDGRRYHLTSLQGNGIYKIGNTATLFYLPNKPSDAREAAYLPFDLMWLSLGSIALALSLFSGWIARRFQ